MALVTLSPTINHSPLRPSRGSCLDKQPEPSESDERATQATRAIFNLRPSLVAAGAATIAIDVTLLVTLGSAPPQDKRQPARHSEPVAKRAPCPSPSISRAARPPGPFSIDAKRRRICPILRRGLGGGGDRDSLGQSRDVGPPSSPPPVTASWGCIFLVHCSARRSQVRPRQ
jgi:hypothetical protein